MSNTTQPTPGTALAVNVDKLPANIKAQELKGLLTSRISSIEDVLPSNMKGEGQRLVNRAALYFATKKDLHNYSMSSIVIAVTQSAELGIPIDGRLGHIGSFGGDAVFMPDYKGLVMIAKRSRQIKDCYGDIVGTGDFFECGRQGPVSICNHTPNLEKRGDTKGGYAIVTMPDGAWRYEYMTLEQLDHVRKKSRAQNGPWKTDTEQMYIKTVIKRILKLYVDDPTFIRALEIDDAAEAIDVQFTGGPQREPRARVSPLTRQLSAAPSVNLTPQGTATSEAPSKPRKQREAEESQQDQGGSDPEPLGDEPPADYESTATDPKAAITAEFNNAKTKSAADALKVMYIGAAYPPEIREHAEVCHELALKRIEREKKKPGE